MWVPGLLRGEEAQVAWRELSPYELEDHGVSCGLSTGSRYRLHQHGRDQLSAGTLTSRCVLAQWKPGAAQSLPSRGVTCSLAVAVSMYVP